MVTDEKERVMHRTNELINKGFSPLLIQEIIKTEEKLILLELQIQELRLKVLKLERDTPVQLSTGGQG